MATLPQIVPRTIPFPNGGLSVHLKFPPMVLVSVTVTNSLVIARKWVRKSKLLHSDQVPQGLVVFYQQQPHAPENQPQAPENQDQQPQANFLAISSGHRCLIVHLHDFEHVDGSLAEFLSNPQIRFMGFDPAPLHLGRGLDVVNYNAFPVTAFPDLANTVYGIGHGLQPIPALRELNNWPLTLAQVANATLLAHTASYLH